MAPRRASGSEATISAVSDYPRVKRETGYSLGTKIKNKSLHEVKSEAAYFLGNNVEDQSPHEGSSARPAISSEPTPRSPL